jgi:cytochrome c
VRRDGTARRWALPAAIIGGALTTAISAALASIGQNAPASVGQHAPASSAAFNQCAVCHSIDGSNGTGPTLQHLIGRKSGAVPGFRYSRAMKNAAIIWDEATLARYLTDPQELVPGNIMPFAGVADASQRAEIIAYLRTLR